MIDSAVHRKFSAWILLGVFMPMLLLSVFHIHKMEKPEDVCYECIHHVRHAGHITATTFSVNQCVLCEFLALVYLAPAAIIPVVLTLGLGAVQNDLETWFPSCRIAMKRLRAPPYGLFI
ncbi:hypothetical protein [Prevotella sp. KH2C16]|uniref:hypothetical protein n=1 Tax=Prevotella sp. KH2C16 TaxID=1855325 RepID=UPI0008DFE0B0|nr:hypothetical protein [Prevotella sp. KH2C16]SFF84244.1 hypothetical protein SAMN05216383_101164 [Prevotella sp. KH2C16]